MTVGTLQPRTLAPECATQATPKEEEGTDVDGGLMVVLFFHQPQYGASRGLALLT